MKLGEYNYIMIALCNNLKSLRKLKKMTQIELADLAGISIVSFIRYENDPESNPSLNALLKLSKALDCDIFDLLKENIELEKAQHEIEDAITLNKIMKLLIKYPKMQYPILEILIQHQSTLK